tara:strand:+ start:1438 stop:2013 length:576 start_codon:yes stop_codon:yes gene_type:complete
MTSLSNIIGKRNEKVKAVVERVCEWHGLFPHALFKRGRKRPLVEARQEAWYFIRRNVRSMNGLKISLSEIGSCATLWDIKELWDHASVLHAVRLIDGRRDVDKMYDSHMEKADKEISDLIKNMDSTQLDSYNPTLHYHEMLAHLTYNLCERNDSEEVDFLIKTLNEKRNNETSDQDTFKDLEMEVVQGAIN